MLNVNEERFMVSDSLKSTLGPESLMGQPLVKNFALNIDGCNHAIQHYRESKSGITIKFNCSTEHLENILAKQSGADCLVCSGEKVLRDLSGYQQGYEILNTDAGGFSVTMHFQEMRKGVLND